MIVGWNRIDQLSKPLGIQHRRTNWPQIVLPEHTLEQRKVKVEHVVAGNRKISYKFQKHDQDYLKGPGALPSLRVIER